MLISGYGRAWSDNEFSKEDAAGEALQLNFGLELVQFFCVGAEFFVSKPDFSQVWAYFLLKRRKMRPAELFLYSSVQDLRLLGTEAYCVKCKAKREMKGERAVTMKNGRNALTGTCSVCGTKMFKIGGGGGGKAKAKAKAATKKKAKGRKRK
jgi:Domain of unknown function (DUF5679)